MDNTLTTKELREKLPWVREQVLKGKHFIVIYRSKPLFEISPVSTSGNKKFPLLGNIKKLRRPYPGKKKVSAVDLIRAERD
jgi:hypothetical protein